MPGGMYIPPSRRRRDDDNDAELTLSDDAVKLQKQLWEALKKSINSVVNRVSADTLKHIVLEAFQENLIRGRGLYCRTVMRAQKANPEMTGVFAALTAVINSKIPSVGELMVHRLVSNFKKSYQRRDSPTQAASLLFIAHLVVHQVVHHVLALQLLATLLCNDPSPTDVEAAVAFLETIHRFIEAMDPKTLREVLDPLREILSDQKYPLRTRVRVEGMFNAIKQTAKSRNEVPLIPDDLDLVEEEDQITHTVMLDDEMQTHDKLDFFQYDENYDETEKEYEEFKAALLGDGDSDDGEDGEQAVGRPEDSGPLVPVADASSSGDGAFVMNEKEFNFVREKIVLAMKSSLSFEEATHKLLKLLKDGQEELLVDTLIDACCRESSFQKFHPLIGERLCLLNSRYQRLFLKIFAERYEMAEDMEMSHLRHLSQFYGFLLVQDAIPWEVFAPVKLTEEDTNASSRIILKHVFQAMAEGLGVRKLNERLADPSVQPWIAGLFPTDSLAHARFSINFFTEIGLGVLTEAMRRWYSQALADQERREAEEMARFKRRRGAP